MEGRVLKGDKKAIENRPHPSCFLKPRLLVLIHILCDFLSENSNTTVTVPAASKPPENENFSQRQRRGVKDDWCFDSPTAMYKSWNKKTKTACLPKRIFQMQLTKGIIIVLYHCVSFVEMRINCSLFYYLMRRMTNDDARVRPMRITVNVDFLANISKALLFLRQLYKVSY